MPYMPGKDSIDDAIIFVRPIFDIAAMAQIYNLFA